jgi:hypothetical protein
MLSIFKKLLVMAVIASAFTLVFAACEPIENGDFEEPPVEEPMN